jgi:hypothetical protein
MGAFVMNGNRDAIVYLDIVREERKVSIQGFVEGITSRRNYSRLLSGEAELSFEMLGKFLERLGMPLYDFGLFAYNKTYLDNINEIWFHDCIRAEKYQEAYTKYYPLIKDKDWKTIYAKKTIPTAIILMDFQLKRIHKSSAIHSILNILKLSTIVNSTFITADDVEALYLFLRICNDEEKEQIAECFFRFLVEKRNKILSAGLEFTILTMYLSTLTALTTKETLNNRDRILILQVFRSALEYHIKAKMMTFDVLLFETIYKFIKKNQIRSKWIVFHYIASIASSFGNSFTRKTIIDLDEADRSDYLECIQDENFWEESMYERLLKNEIF